MQEGVDGLLRDRMRMSGKAPLPVETVQRVLDRFVEENNANPNPKPKPFVWTADPDRVLTAVSRGKQALESIR